MMHLIDYVFRNSQMGRVNVPAGLAMATAARVRTVRMENCILNDGGVYKIVFYSWLGKGENES